MAGRCARCVLSACISRSFVVDASRSRYCYRSRYSAPCRIPAMRFRVALHTDAITESIGEKNGMDGSLRVSRYLRTREKDKKEKGGKNGQEGRGIRRRERWTGQRC